MKISVVAWTRYKDRLSKIDQRAVDEMTEFLRQIHGWEGHEPQVLAFAYGLSTKYGEAAAAAACEMYDTCARASGRRVPKAEPAPTATYNETAKAVRGTVKNRSESQIPNTVGRLVKQAGADTTLRNVARDGAQFAWVPSGDTCPFCIMLASNGWQYISKNTLKKGHAEHIHANCDCQYAVRFSEQDGVAGYDPNQYKEIYDNADGNTWQEKLRSMQHDNYEANKDKINARRRELYSQHGKLKQTGGHHYAVSEDSPKKTKKAAAAYEKFARINDSQRIAKHTGFKEEEIAKVRSHIFIRKHRLYESYDRLEPDYDIAVAWKRLREGTHKPRDITLLNHEILESDLELRYNLSIEEAHAMASSIYDWESQLFEELGEEGEPDGLL